jgi:MFS family permease
MTVSSDTAPEAPAPTGAFVALRHRDFRLLWTGQMMSLVGTHMRGVAIIYQLYHLTHQPLSLGMLGACGLIPVLLLSIPAGLAADTLDRRKLVLAMQAGMMACSFGLFWLSWHGLMDAWMIYGLVAASACFFTFDLTARGALIPGLVPREHLPNALSLNVLAWQTAAVSGPALGGVIIARWGVVPVYGFDAASFLMVVAALAALRWRRPADLEVLRPSLAAALEGLRFVMGDALIRSSMLLDFIAMVFGASNTMLPIFADQILSVGARGLGLLYAAPSLGAIVSGYFVASASTHMRNRGKILLVAVAIYGACIAGFGASRWFWLSVVLLAGSGAADTVSAVIRSTLRQLLTPDELRGRMTSVNMVFFVGGPHLGEIEAGVAAHFFGVAASVVLGGIGCVLSVTLVALMVPVLRRYDR